MGVGTLNNRSAGETILDTFFNDIHSAMNGDFVGRNSSGVATSGQNLGTTAIPWGVVRATSLVLNGSAVDSSLITRPQNVITSGAKRASSNQPAFIDPDGTGLSFVIDGTPTNLVFDVNGTSVTVSTDITKSSLTAAPSSNNTCLVDDTTAADQQDTRLWGEPEHRKVITIDTIGSEITALNGKRAAFMLDNGSATEYFTAIVDTTNNRLHRCRRGYFYDSAGNPKNRIVFSNNDTITLLKMGWIFIENNATTVDVTYTEPIWSTDSPSSPVTGDYWYDQSNNVWKRYDGATFQIINRTLVGIFCNTSSACVGARCEPFYANYKADNTVAIEFSSTEIARIRNPFAQVSVAGQLISFGSNLRNWNITTDLAGSADMYDATEQASRMYYLYIKDTGDTVISDISPYFMNEMYGRYHPHNPWRCVGLTYNNASSNLTVASDFKTNVGQIYVNVNSGYGSTATHIPTFSNTVENTSAGALYLTDATNGNSVTIFDPGVYESQTLMNANVGNNYGISLNSTQLTTDIGSNSLTASTRLVSATINNADRGVGLTTSNPLLIGDVLRSHADSAAAGANTHLSCFKVRKTGNTHVY